MRDSTRIDLRLAILYINQVAQTRPVVERPLMDKLCNANSHYMVEECFVHFHCIFLSIHLSAIINADTDSLENA